MRTLLLDLFCGAGGAAYGYHLAGFDVIGVDINPQPHYPFTFVQDDALRLLEVMLDGESLYIGSGNPCYGRGGQYLSLSSFSAIHASPPCQAYTTMANRHGRSDYAVIDETRRLLRQRGVPYVIENVPGAKSHMRSPIELTGEMFGLRVHRPRLFESNVMLLASPRPSRQTDPVAVYGKNDQRRLWTRADGSELHAATLKEASAAMGIDWMNWDEIREAIPPAYTEFIGDQLMRYVGAFICHDPEAQWIADQEASHADH